MKIQISHSYFLSLHFCFLISIPQFFFLVFCNYSNFIFCTLLFWFISLIVFHKHFVMKKLSSGFERQTVLDFVSGKILGNPLPGPVKLKKNTHKNLKSPFRISKICWFCSKFTKKRTCFIGPKHASWGTRIYFSKKCVILLIYFYLMG